MGWRVVLASVLLCSALTGCDHGHSVEIALPELIDCQGNEAAVRPASIALACGDGGILADIGWTTWTTENATGTGAVKINQCKPDCAKGSYRSIEASFMADTPVTEHATRFFTRLVVRASNGGSPVRIECPLAHPTGKGDLRGGCVGPLSTALHLRGPAY